MKFVVTHRTAYTYTEPVAVCHNMVHLAPRNLPHQQCSDYRLTVNPEPPCITARNDYFGNRVEYFSVQDPHTAISISARSELIVAARPVVNPSNSPAWETAKKQMVNDLTPAGLDARQYLIASPYTRLDRQFADYARGSFEKGRPLVQAALDLTSRIYHEFRYEPGATHVHSTLDDVMQKRRGVCQDFAHLQIACLRSIGLAARYVSGYLRTLPPPGKPRLVGSDASHAWLGLYCGPLLGWVDFDPTNNQIPGTDHLTLAWGRDYSDVCPIQGVVVGGGLHSMAVSVDVDAGPSGE